MLLLYLYYQTPTPFPCTGNPPHNLQATEKTKTDFREEDELNNGSALHGYNGLTEYPWTLWLHTLHGLHTGWHLPGGWPSSTLQLPAESGSCTPESTCHIFLLPGQFCRPDTRRGTCIWGAWCSFGTNRCHGGLLFPDGISRVSSMGQSSETPFWGPCLPWSARVSFGAGSFPVELDGSHSVAIWANCLVGDNSGDLPTSSNFFTSSLLLSTSPRVGGVSVAVCTCTAVWTSTLILV